MAFKLTKDEQTTRAQRAEACREAAAQLTGAIDAYNEATAAARMTLQLALAGYNEALSELRGFVEDISSRAEDEFSDKSETWQEGDRGQEVAAWRDDWESAAAELDDVEIDLPEPLDEPELDHAGLVDNLEVEP